MAKLWITILDLQNSVSQIRWRGGIQNVENRLGRRSSETCWPVQWRRSTELADERRRQKLVEIGTDSKILIRRVHFRCQIIKTMSDLSGNTPKSKSNVAGAREFSGDDRSRRWLGFVPLDMENMMMQLSGKMEVGFHRNLAWKLMEAKLWMLISDEQRRGRRWRLQVTSFVGHWHAAKRD